MTDVFSKAKRSEIMSKIRSSRTRAELLLKSSLEDAGIPFQYQPAISGRPDFLIKKRIAVFVNGCFWHGCPIHYREPTTNVNYWRKKLLANETRQRKSKAALRRDGFKVLSVWEHDVKRKPSRLVRRFA